MQWAAPQPAAWAVPQQQTVVVAGPPTGGSIRYIVPAVPPPAPVVTTVTIAAPAPAAPLPARPPWAADNNVSAQAREHFEQTVQVLREHIFSPRFPEAARSESAAVPAAEFGVPQHPQATAAQYSRPVTPPGRAWSRWSTPTPPTSPRTSGVATPGIGGVFTQLPSAVHVLPRPPSPPQSPRHCFTRVFPTVVAAPQLLSAPPMILASPAPSYRAAGCGAALVSPRVVAPSTCVTSFVYGGGVAPPPATSTRVPPRTPAWALSVPQPPTITASPLLPPRLSATPPRVLRASSAPWTQTAMATSVVVSSTSWSGGAAAAARAAPFRVAPPPQDPMEAEEVLSVATGSGELAESDVGEDSDAAPAGRFRGGATSAAAAHAAEAGQPASGRRPSSREPDRARYELVQEPGMAERLAGSRPSVIEDPHLRLGGTGQQGPALGLASSARPPPSPRTAKVVPPPAPSAEAPRPPLARQEVVAALEARPARPRGAEVGSVLEARCSQLEQNLLAAQAEREQMESRFREQVRSLEETAARATRELERRERQVQELEMRNADLAQRLDEREGEVAARRTPTGSGSQAPGGRRPPWAAEATFDGMPQGGRFGSLTDEDDEGGLDDIQTLAELRKRLSGNVGLGDDGGYEGISRGRPASSTASSNGPVARTPPGGAFPAQESVRMRRAAPTTYAGTVPRLGRSSVEVVPPVAGQRRRELETRPEPRPARGR